MLSVIKRAQQQQENPDAIVDIPAEQEVTVQIEDGTKYPATLFGGRLDIGILKEQLARDGLTLTKLGGKIPYCSGNGLSRITFTTTTIEAQTNRHPGLDTLDGRCFCGLPSIMDQLMSKTETDVYRTNDQGQNALMAACNRTRGGYAIEKYWDQTTSGDLLALPWLALPMKALSMDSAENAASQARRFVLLRLLKEVCDMNLTDKKGCTALHMAVNTGHREGMELPVARGADLTIAVPDMFGVNKGMTALNIAVSMGRKRAVEILLGSEKQDRHALTRDKEECLIRAAELGKIAVIADLAVEEINWNAFHKDRNALFKAVAKGHVEVVHLLLEHGADLSRRNAQGDTALMLAAGNGCGSIVNYLLQEDVRANPSLVNKKNNCALVLAAARGHTEVVVKLASRQNGRGHDPSQAQKALVAACRGGHLTTVRVLTMFGYGEDKHEAQMARDVAFECEHATIVNFLDHITSEKDTHKTLAEADMFITEAAETWDKDVKALTKLLEEKAAQSAYT
ncbi:Ankyrin repeat domain-containing protein 17 [Trebouxia sp. C0009 RCD-2024]